MILYEVKPILIRAAAMTKPFFINGGFRKE